MDNNSVKENISKLRRRLGLSQEAMAEKMGISRTAYRNIEAGKTRLMSENIDKIASILGISAEELMLGYRPEEGGSREFSDMKAQYGTKIKEIENGYEEEIRKTAEEHIRRAEGETRGKSCGKTGEVKS